MTVQNFTAGAQFMTPAFRIELEGRDAGRDVISDVLEVSFTDDLNAIDSFEFVLHDWDVATRLPRYSSPWDANGQPLKLYEGGPDVPNFEPGAKVSLYLGYVEAGDLPLVMNAEVVSVAPAFPAAGSPTCRVRALDAFQRGMQKVHVHKNYHGTSKDVVDQMCAENSISVRWGQIDDLGESREQVEVDGVLFEEIQKRATEYGLWLMTEESGGSPSLYLANAVKDDSDKVADFIWGRTLISFTPAFSAAAQISAVVVRYGDHNAPSGGNNEVRKTWSDVGLVPSALGPAGRVDLEHATGGVEEVLKPNGVATKAAAESHAVKHLKELATTLITGSGASVGLPTLRAGKTVNMAQMGARFDGDYRVTQTTHVIAGAGYTTTFQARKVVL